MLLHPRDTSVCLYLEYITPYLWCLLMVFASSMAANKDGLPNLVSRKEWGALPARIYPKMIPLKHPVPYIVVSYFTPDITEDKLALQVMQQKHMDAGLPDIQANFLVSKNGTIYEGRGWDLKPPKSAEFPNYDGKYIEIAYIGNFNDEPVEHPIYKATWSIFDYGRSKKYISDNFVVLSEKYKSRLITK